MLSNRMPDLTRRPTSQIFDEIDLGYNQLMPFAFDLHGCVALHGQLMVRIESKSKIICYLMKIDCLYELFVTNLGCSLFRPRRMIIISS
jgi:hypothetical protein